MTAWGGFLTVQFWGGNGVLRIRRQLRSLVQHRLVNVEVTRRLRNTDTTFANQSNRLDLELTPKLATLHGAPPASPSHLNRVSVKPAAGQSIPCYQCREADKDRGDAPQLPLDPGLLRGRDDPARLNGASAFRHGSGPQEISQHVAKLRRYLRES